MNKIGFIFKREVSAYFNSAVAYIVVILFLVITGSLFWLNYFQDINVLSLRGFFAQAPLFLAFFAPAITMGLFAQEKRSGTLELMMTLPVSDFQIVAGKFLAAVFLLATVFAVTLVYPYSLSLLGPLDWGAVWSGYIGLLLLGATYAAIGLMASSWSTDQVVSILVGFSLCIFLYLIEQLVAHPTGTTAQIIEYLSTGYHFRNIARGVIDSRDIIYYFSLIGVCLVVAKTSIAAPRRKHRWVKGASAALMIVAAVASALLINVISSQFFARVDLTDNQSYTLSEVSLGAARNLKEPVHVKAVISPDLPPPMHNLAQSVADSLDEYVSASAGKLTYEIVSPSDDAKLDEDARSVGCEKVGISRRSADEVTVRAVYKCVAFAMGEDLEVVGDLRPAAGGALADFEYDFTRALLNLQVTQPRKVAFVSGYGGPVSYPRFLDTVKPVFEQLYGKLIEVQTIDLAAKSPTIGDDIAALVILNADEPFSEDAIFALDQFIQRGGNVGWYQSATAVDLQAHRQYMQQFPDRQPPPFRRAIDPGLSKVFDSYGLELRPDLVLDPERGVDALAMTAQGIAEVRHPATFMMDNLDQTLPFMRNFSALAMPAPSTIALKPEAVENKSLKIHRVIQTEASARRRSNIPSAFQYEVLAQPESLDSPGPWTVAVAVEGTPPSYFDTHPLPAGRTSADLKRDPASARIFIVGSGNFFQAMPEIGYGQGLAELGVHFLIASIEWLVQDSALSEIRSKSMPRLIGKVDAESRYSLQFVNIAVVPALFAGVGVLMMRRRRRRKEALQRD
ncbi:Gldg family protein [Bradymonas sediminis]|uniref:Uncharacterized protein n=1 Tax=Bradymonas sediminis TaxID=1548548 RepID=A0A2Z4FQL9_9DELT|nr:Gldg family protein [Bradymonas sediminis]AWV91095.1 hypothetical protein DN745_17860 [Bradymonas sediminis]TDP75162.1 ABC-type transport system involved in multi-copper enzyme maturation permease subunit [Bradymonas sediminis]